jgi:hypothetical protein
MAASTGRIVLQFGMAQQHFLVAGVNHQPPAELPDLRACFWSRVCATFPRTAALRLRLRSLALKPTPSPSLTRQAGRRKPPSYPQ